MILKEITFSRFNNKVFISFPYNKRGKKAAVYISLILKKYISYRAKKTSWIKTKQSTPELL